MAENKGFDRWVGKLSNPDQLVRRDACYALGRLGDVRALGPLIQRLGDKDSSVRRAACQALGQLMGSGCLARGPRRRLLRAADALIKQLGNEDSDVRDAASRALKSIGKAVEGPHELLCRACLAIFQQQDYRLKRVGTVSVPVCRLCGKAAGAIPNVREVVAVLDTGMGEELSSVDGVVRVGYLKRDAPFDFDRVEIVRASDYEVERFCVQVGNDTDPFRRGRYRRMPCLVAPGCRLSENTLRILGSMFGRVSADTSER